VIVPVSLGNVETITLGFGWLASFLVWRIPAQGVLSLCFALAGYECGRGVGDPPRASPEHWLAELPDADVGLRDAAVTTNDILQRVGRRLARRVTHASGRPRP